MPGLFVGGGYTPLRGNQHVAAFARSFEGQHLVIAAPVQVATLARGALVAPVGPELWREERLIVPGRVYRDLFTARELTAVDVDGRPTLKLAEVLGDLPVAALLSE
jgi:maltooligosyltrehalose synthase